jgi:hypothetical protein
MLSIILTAKINPHFLPFLPVYEIAGWSYIMNQNIELLDEVAIILEKGFDYFNFHKMGTINHGQTFIMHGNDGYWLMWDNGGEIGLSLINKSEDVQYFIPTETTIPNPSSWDIATMIKDRISGNPVNYFYRENIDNVKTWLEIIKGGKR